VKFFWGSKSLHFFSKLQDFEKQVRNLGLNTFSQPGQQLYHDIMTKHAWLTAPPEEKGEVNNFERVIFI
jgi:hypothetical protein